MAGRERVGGGQLSLIPLVTSFSELPAQHLPYFVASFVTIPLRTEDKKSCHSWSEVTKNAEVIRTFQEFDFRLPEVPSNLI